MSQYEPTDSEIADGQYQPYRSHPAGGELQPAAPAPAQLPAEESRPLSKKEREAEALVGNQKFALAIVSLGAGIPITAIAATNVQPGLLGVIVAWAGIVGVNVVHHVSRRKRP